MAAEVKEFKKVLTADDILAADDVQIIPVEMPEWKGTVHLRTMTADEAVKFTEYLSDPANKRKGLVRIVALSLCDEKGNRLFPDGPDSGPRLDKLRTKNVKAFVRLQKEAMKLNGYDEEGGEKALLENAKND
jgi:hypothetical protein